MDDENTSLLASNAPSDLQVPSIIPASRRVAALGVNRIRFDDVVNDGLNLKDHPTEVAFALAVLLHLRKTRRETPPSTDVYAHWLARNTAIRDADILENLTTEIWTLFLAEYCSMRDIQTVLWTPFRLEDGIDHVFRVVDFLAEPDSPASLLSHPLIVVGIEHAWNHGIDCESSPTSSFLARYDRLSTPRVIHIIDWMVHALFLGLLAHYLLYPIAQPRTSNGWSWYHYGPREVFLAILPLCFAVRSRSLANTSSLLVPLAFLTSLPSAPHPDSLSFVLLQWAAFLQPFGLNLPQAPSHLYFIQASRSLPLAFLINRGLSHILYPVITFFLPLLLLATYLLSRSLAGSFLQINVIETLLSPSPLETRFTFLCFFATVVIFFLASTCILTTSAPLTSHSEDPWDIYSPAVGNSARRALAGVVASYNTPYSFPPLFNLVQFLAVWVPRRTAGVFGRSPSSLKLMERAVWRIAVGPFTAIVALFLWRPRWISSRPNNYYLA